MPTRDSVPFPSSASRSDSGVEDLVAAKRMSRDHGRALIYTSFFQCQTALPIDCFVLCDVAQVVVVWGVFLTCFPAADAVGVGNF